MMTATQPLIFAENEIHEITPIDILKVPPRVMFHARNQHALKLDDFCNQINNLISKNQTKNILVEMKYNFHCNPSI